MSITIDALTGLAVAVVIGAAVVIGIACYCWGKAVAYRDVARHRGGYQPRRGADLGSPPQGNVIAPPPPPPPERDAPYRLR